MRADLAFARQCRPAGVAAHLFPNVFVIATHRLAHALGTAGMPRLAHVVSIITQVLTGAEIAWEAEIGGGCFFEHPVGVVIPESATIGERAIIGAGVLIGASVPHGASNPGYAIIGDGVQIWARASVLGPVHVGDGAVIGAHALVLSDVPAGAVARGVPARCYDADGNELLTDD